MGSGPRRRETSSKQLALITLVILVAFGLRLAYAVRTNPFVDEFTSVWAGKLILQQGVPVTPAGILYNRGLVFSYLEALSLAAFGVSKLATRMPSILAGMISVALMYLVGKRLFSVGVGLLASFLLSFSADAITWGGRARMYALLQTVALLAVYFLYLGGRDSRGRYLFAFAGCFSLAAFVHIEAIVLYPAAVLVLVVFRKLRWFLSKEALLVNGVCWLGILSAYVVQKLGWSPDVEQLSGAAGLDGGYLAQLWAGVSRHIGFFLQTENLTLTALFLLGGIYLLGYGVLLAAAHAESAGVGREGPDWRRNLAVLYLVFCPVWLAIVTIGGVSYSNPRYTFMIQSLFLLICAAITGLLARSISRAWRIRAPNLFGSFRASFRAQLVGCVLVVAVVTPYLPGAVSALADEQPGYDHAALYVRERLQEGDAVITLSPPVAAVHLGRCDYFAIQRRYEDRVVERDGELVDMWTGAPLLNTIEYFQAVLMEHERVWLFADNERMARRYNPDFLYFVVEHMALTQEIEGVKVVLFEGPYASQEPIAWRDVGVNFADKMSLVGYGLGGDALEPGGQTSLSLRWHVLAPLVESYSVSVHLVDAKNALWAQNDGAPLRGLYPTTHWIPGEIVPDLRELTLPIDIPEGRYRLEVGVYKPENLEHLTAMNEERNELGDRIVLDYVEILEQPAEAFSPEHVLNADLSHQVTLQGYDLDTSIASAGSAVQLALYWRAQREMDEDYTVFVHLMDDAGRIWGQSDAQPENGFYPTSFWDKGEVVKDEHRFAISSSAPSGRYRIEVGIYLLATGQRLPVLTEDGKTAGDAVLLASLEVRE